MKLIIYAEPDDFILAMRAAKWLIDHPEHKSTIVSYEGRHDFYAWRNRDSIAVRDVSKNGQTEDRK